MARSQVRAALRRERQKKRLITLENLGISTKNWKDKTELRNFVIFGRILPRATS